MHILSPPPNFLASLPTRRHYYSLIS